MIPEQVTLPDGTGATEELVAEMLDVVVVAVAVGGGNVKVGRVGD
jgi:hypothetical protein